MPGCAQAADGEPFRFVGDPVDVVTGAVSDHTRDFRLIGPLFLDWFRSYDSARHRTACSLGWGHGHAYAWQLLFDADGISALDPVGRRTGFAALRRDGDRDRKGALTLERAGLRVYRLHRAGEPVFEFTFHALAEAAGLTRAFRGAAEIVFHRDASDGRLTGITHSTGLRLGVTEDAATGRLLRVEGAWDGTDEVRPVLVCEYDPAGNLVRMVDAFGRTWSFGWDEANRLVRKTDRRGYSFLFEYDAAGQCVRSAGEDGVLGVVLHYRTEERITEVRKADSGLWQYFYNEQGSVTQIIGPYGGVRKFVRDDVGRVVGEIDPLGHSLDYVFDAGGRVVEKRFATGRVVEVRGGIEMPGPPPHRVADRPEEWDYGALRTRLGLSLDPPPRSSPRATVIGAAPREPDPLPNSPRVPPCCDDCDPWYPEPEAGRRFAIFGHLTEQKLPSGRRRWTYDANDSMEVYTDADGAVTRQVRRSWNQLDRRIDPMSGETAYGWTLQENLAAVTDPGGTRSEYAWDRESRLLGVRRDGTVREIYRYDAAGNLVEKRDGTGATLLTLVPTADRLIAERRLASGDVHRFAYDAEGRFLRAATETVETRFAYDAFGQRTLDERDGQGVRHEFHGRGRLASTTVLGRYVIRYEYDVDGRGLTIAMPGQGSLRIERCGERRLWRDCGNGTGELSQYDWMGQCVFRGLVSTRGERRLWTRYYRYSAEGDLQGVEDSREGVTRYRYDGAHRLVTAEPLCGPAEVFAYDSAGNLLVQPGLEDVRIAGGNRLASANGDDFVYDARHHIAERRHCRGTTSYHYDSRGMLLACELTGDATWRAEYDAIGRRTRVTQGEAEQRFYWDTDRLAAEIDAGGRLRVYVYADLLALTPLAFIDYAQEGEAAEEGRVHFVFSDQRGTPVLVQNIRGELEWQARLSPYGAAMVTAPNGLTLNLRFPGHYFDPSIGLHYNRFRYYDPMLSRFLQSDPIGIAGGLNVYAYPANPLTRVDVRGLTGSDGDSCPLPGSKGQGEDSGDQEKTAAQGRRILGLGDDYNAHIEGKHGLLAELDKEGMLNLYIVRGPNTPSGSGMFEEAMDKFRPNVKGVRGTWLGGGDLKDNFDSYKAGLAKGLTPEESARTHTFTGKMADRAGFSNVKVVKDTDGKVVAEFRK